MSKISKSSATHNRGLGKGFDALLPQNFDSILLTNSSDRIQQVKIDDIIANTQQPRRHFDVDALKELAESIKRFGVLQPLVATPSNKGVYELIAGERRWRAARLAGLKTLPVIVRSSEELERLEIAIVENVQRVDLSPLEQATSIDRLNQQFNMPFDEIAKRLGKAPSTIHNTARLLQLPAEAQKALHEQKITEGHARCVLALKGSPEAQMELLRSIIKRGWSVRQAEHFVTALKRGAPDQQTAHRQIRTETLETKRLGKRLNTAVSLRHTAHGGKLEIGFSSEDELKRLIDILMGYRQ